MRQLQQELGRDAGFGDEQAIIEVKIWLRRDHENIHAQVISYLADGVAALATVMIADIQDPDWPEKYAAKCLDGKTTYERKEAPGTVAGHFVAGTGHPEAPEVDHFLLRLGRRR